MKVSFQTLACPDWSWEQIVQQATELRYDGIEVRGIQGEMYLPKAKPFLPEHIHQTRKGLEERGLSICCMDTSCLFHDPARFEEALQEGRDTIDLAHAMGTPYIRVFGDKIPDCNNSDAVIAAVASGLEELGQFAESRGVTVLLETHGDFWSSDLLLAVLSQTKSPAIGILWDFEHPYIHGETAAYTFEKLGQLIKHTHIKDSKVTPDGRKLCLIGEGDVPVEAMVELLRRNGYDGWLSLEYEKKWQPALEEPEVSLPAFKRYIERIQI